MGVPGPSGKLDSKYPAYNKKITMGDMHVQMLALQKAVSRSVGAEAVSPISPECGVPEWRL